VSVVHVVPEGGVLEHVAGNGIGCWCIPTVEDLGRSPNGEAALLIHHVLYDDRLNPVEGWGVFTQNSPTIDVDDEGAAET